MSFIRLGLWLLRRERAHGEWRILLLALVIGVGSVSTTGFLGDRLTRAPYCSNFGHSSKSPRTNTHRSTDTTAGSRTVSVSNDVSVLRVGLSAGLGGWFNL